MYYAFRLMEKEVFNNLLFNIKICRKLNYVSNKIFYGVVLAAGKGLHFNFHKAILRQRTKNPSLDSKTFCLFNL